MNRDGMVKKGILSGKKVAASMYADSAERIRRRTGIRPPGLAVILLGDDPASVTYTASKSKHAGQIGILSRTVHLSERTSEAELLEHIETLNADESIDGILVQLPLPEHVNPAKVQQAIRADKDVDGFHPLNLGLLMQNEPALRPCTPQGIMRLLAYYDLSPAGKNAVVLGRSTIVGKPMAQLLTAADATVSLLHSKTPNRGEYLARAELLVVAVGRAEEIRISELREGSVVIDVGIHRTKDHKLLGDVERGAESKVLVTPVPGGVGPLTVAQLMENCVLAWERHTVVNGD